MAHNFIICFIIPWFGRIMVEERKYFLLKLILTIKRVDFGV
jgi:hypothetical protein